MPIMSSVTCFNTQTLSIRVLSMISNGIRNTLARPCELSPVSNKSAVMELSSFLGFLFGIILLKKF
jgi:hypothetical protein